MKKFAILFQELDRTNKTNEKVALMKAYFLSAPDTDKIWALALFTGRRPPRPVKSAQLKEWALEKVGIPLWLYMESYNSVGDMAETISLLLPAHDTRDEKSLSEWFDAMAAVANETDEAKKDFILNAWQQLSAYEVFVFNKLMMGSFRIGVSQTLLIRAISEATDQSTEVVTHRVMGSWDPFHTTYHELIHSEQASDQFSKPYPFYLAYAIEGEVANLGDADDWFVEWKWDGIRAQVIVRNKEFYIWSRGEELVTDKFPELHCLEDALPDGCVLDGEIVCYKNDAPMPFNILQTRIGRKNVSKKILQDAPVVFISYDVMEYKTEDVRARPQQERRGMLQQLHGDHTACDVFKLSPLIEFDGWQSLTTLHTKSREMAAEGFMLKRKSARYLTGRKKGDWWKWKIAPLSIDAVLIYAQKGHGRRAEFYTDYTFAVWDNGTLVPFAKAYSGLTDEEIRKVDYFVKNNTREKFGPVRTVAPKLVFEIGFEGINASPRHKSGIAVRFPRILRWRKDKPVEEADSLEALQAILKQYS